jgi:hypothetical protein
MREFLYFDEGADAQAHFLTGCAPISLASLQDCGERLLPYWGEGTTDCTRALTYTLLGRGPSPDCSHVMAHACGSDAFQCAPWCMTDLCLSARACAAWDARADATCLRADSKAREGGRDGWRAWLCRTRISILGQGQTKPPWRVGSHLPPARAKLAKRKRKKRKPARSREIFTRILPSAYCRSRCFQRGFATCCQESSGRVSQTARTGGRACCAPGPCRSRAAC